MEEVSKLNKTLWGAAASKSWIRSDRSERGLKYLMDIYYDTKTQGKENSTEQIILNIGVTWLQDISINQMNVLH